MWLVFSLACAPQSSAEAPPPPEPVAVQRCTLPDEVPETLMAESRVIPIRAVKASVRRSQLVTDPSSCTYEDCRVVPSLAELYGAMRPGLEAGTAELGTRSPHYPRTTLRAVWGETECVVADGRRTGVVKADKAAFDQAWATFIDAVVAAPARPAPPSVPAEPD